MRSIDFFLTYEIFRCLRIIYLLSCFRALLTEKRIARRKLNHTYMIVGEDGSDQGPFRHVDMLQKITSGSITGSTLVKRHDSEHWGTAADFEELKVADKALSPHEQVHGVRTKPEIDPLTAEKEKSGYTNSTRSATYWFLLAAGATILSAMRWALGSKTTYGFGLELPRVMFAAQDYMSPGLSWLPWLMVFLLPAIMLGGALGAWQGWFWPYLIAMFLYIGDFGLALIGESWFTAGLHGLAIVFMAFGLVGFAYLKEKPWWQISWPGLPVTAVALVAGLMAMKLYDPRFEKVEPAPWVNGSGDKWPQLVLANTATFKGHTFLEAGCASLARLPDGEVVAVSARHLLSEDGGVEPEIPLEKLDQVIEKWLLHPLDADQKSVEVTGLYSHATNYFRAGEVALLRLKETGKSSLPAEPLNIRRSPLATGDKIFVVAASPIHTQGKQKVYPGTVISQVEQLLMARVDGQVNMRGFSGAPVLDEHGRLVAIVTSGPAKSANTASTMFTGITMLDVNRILAPLTQQVAIK